MKRQHLLFYLYCFKYVSRKQRFCCYGWSKQGVLYWPTWWRVLWYYSWLPAENPGIILMLFMLDLRTCITFLENIRLQRLSNACNSCPESKLNEFEHLKSSKKPISIEPLLKTWNIPSNKSEEFPQILQLWWLSLRNFQGISRESFPVFDSSEILEKFSRIGP